MPILEIEILKRSPEDSLSKATVQELADAAGRILDTSVGRTWVKVRDLPISQYAENDCQLEESVRPVMVTILKAKLPSREALKREVADLTRAFAEILDRPSKNVHIKYEPEGSGRIAFGGNLVE